MRLLVAPEGLTRPSGEAKVCQGGRALSCLRRRGRARRRLFAKPRVVNIDVLFTSFSWVSLILIPVVAPEPMEEWGHSFRGLRTSAHG
jgi:hypothetical protein